MKISMTIDECLEFADEWSRGLTLYEGAQGWRVVCMLLAGEVRRMRLAEPDFEDVCEALVSSRVVDVGAIQDADLYDNGETLELVRGFHERLVALKTPNVKLTGAAPTTGGKSDE